MIRETYLANLKREKILISQCILVCRGRGNDELAPSEQLLKDFLNLKKEYEKSMGVGSAEAHNKAFTDCNYEVRFIDEIKNRPNAVEKLISIKKRSITDDIWLVCYEGYGKRCHRHILLRLVNEFVVL